MFAGTPGSLHGSRTGAAQGQAQDKPEQGSGPPSWRRVYDWPKSRRRKGRRGSAARFSRLSGIMGRLLPWASYGLPRPVARRIVLVLTAAICRERVRGYK
jgi:hypothetical protein